jgi:ubiquinone/menaquinone biosynthesis C-methylase UbiE
MTISHARSPHGERSRACSAQSVEVLPIRVFYMLLRIIYHGVFGRQHMLHYPLYREKGQTLLEGQIHLTNACISHLGELARKHLLDVGCGNGLQTLYLYDNFALTRAVGVDINATHIALAEAAAATLSHPGLSFVVDDAQVLGSAGNESFDLLLCTESAHHYPDKEAFLMQVTRVLRPGGRFVVADLLLREGVQARWFDRWFSLFYWSLARYESAFPRHGLRLETKQELTDQLVEAFRSSQRWFGCNDRKGLFTTLAKIVGRWLVALYIHELTTRYRYYLLVGVRT